MMYAQSSESNPRACGLEERKMSPRVWTCVRADSRLLTYTKGTYSKQILQRGFHLPVSRGHVFVDPFCFLTVAMPPCAAGWRAPSWSPAVAHLCCCRLLGTHGDQWEKAAAGVASGSE